MRKLRLGNRVTRRAVAANCVVVAVAILALCLRRRDRARDWSVMARQTSALLVHRVKEIYRPRTGLMAGTFTVIVVCCAAEYSLALWQVEQTLDVGA